MINKEKKGNYKLCIIHWIPHNNIKLKYDYISNLKFMSFEGCDVPLYNFGA